MNSQLQPVNAPRILVIDDERDITDIVKDTLEDRGYEVQVRHTADTGLAAFREESQDISMVLLDIALQGESGIDTLEQIRQISTDTPVVFMSGYIAGESEAKVLGASDVLMKPFSLDDLESKIQAVLSNT